MSEKRKRYILPEEEIPHYWYNIQADMVNKPMPPLHPATKQPLKAEEYIVSTSLGIFTLFRLVQFENVEP